MILLLLAWSCVPPDVRPAAAFPGAACAKAEIPARWSTYTVEGSTVEALRSSIAERGPGRGLVGVTESKVDFACTRAETLDLQVEVSIDVSVPAWTPPSGVDPALITTWKGLDAAQRVHEQGHVDIARSWLACVGEAAAEEQTCAAAADRIQRVVDAMEAEQDAYDRRTDHGVTQGSVL